MTRTFFDLLSNRLDLLCLVKPLMLFLWFEFEAKHVPVSYRIKKMAIVLTVVDDLVSRTLFLGLFIVSNYEVVNHNCCSNDLQGGLSWP
ncbi:hypothetical protein Hanom_Chr04g00328791 [Helianthus anomalus]